MIIIKKYNGGDLYATTDIATILMRNKDFAPDEIIYITDNRQSQHFKQVFRCCKLAGISPEDQKLSHVAFGTMNGKDGKPFKTRSGGVVRLKEVVGLLVDKAEEKLAGNGIVGNAELARKCNPTQKRIVKYLIHGLRPSQIADKMQYKTVQTVLNHIDRIAVLTAEIIDSNHSELIPLIDKVNGYKERTDKQTASKREYDRKREQTAERKATYKKREQTAERKAYKAQKARERRERDRLAKLQAK